MDRIDDLKAFLAIVEKGNQAAAARHLQRSLQSIGRSLTSVERSVGVPLIKRTTRRSHPTEAGLAFYARVKPALVEIESARAEAADLAREPSGRLRVSAPALFARAFVVPAICEFLTRFPGVEVDLKVSDRPVDLLEDGLDVAVRVRRLPGSTLKARRLGELRIVVFGAKTYLEKHGRPRHPVELSSHRCVVRTVDGKDEPWPFRIDGRRRAVQVRGRFRTDDTNAIHLAVARGLGLGLTPLWQIRDLVERGVVEVVLQPFEVDRMPIYAVLSPTRMQPAKFKLFVDLLSTQVRSSGL
jgi:DNA-binding transcriptional LysR family regulator